MTRVVISQPMYFPWAGFLAQMSLADVYIWLDDVLFSKGSFTNRIQVKLPSGCKWMSVPLIKKGKRRSIQDLEATDVDWKRGHRTLLGQSLCDRRFFDEAMLLFDEAIASEGTLCDCLIASAEVQARYLGVLPPNILRASSLGITGRSWQRVMDIIDAVGGSSYITGHGAIHYFDHEAFEAREIDVRYMSYNLMPWPQSNGDFTPYVSGLDLIASVQPEEALTHLRPESANWRDFFANEEQRNA